MIRTDRSTKHGIRMTRVYTVASGWVELEASIGRISTTLSEGSSTVSDSSSNAVSDSSGSSAVSARSSSNAATEGSSRQQHSERV